MTQALKQHGLPFAISQPTPNAEAIVAMKEADRISQDPAAKSYTDVMMNEHFT
ncbi:MAG: hypothetical protein RSD63_10565 [Eubacterium sp.]